MCYYSEQKKSAQELKKRFRAKKFENEGLYQQTRSLIGWAEVI